eukprot:gene17550-20942_t
MSGLRLSAQLKVGSEGMLIQDGTVFFSEGLTLVPSGSLALNNLSLVRNSTVVIWPKFNSIQRMHRFSKPVAFKGELSMNYLEEELNGNEAKKLSLAYAKVTSTNYKDFQTVKESVVDPKARYIGQLFTEAINLSDLTAVNLEPATDPYKEIEANNMITPNGDGVNDTWVVKNIHLFPNNELRIFDREGRIVFMMFGYDNSWNGQFNGNPLPEDTYYYILTFDSGRSKKTGFISIVRD